LASGKVVITLDCPTTRFYFKSGRDILLVPPNNPDALKNEILRLYHDKKLLKNISENGYSTFKKSFSEEVIGEKIRDIIHKR
jgi:glycosyltransferase involved in cell wall biosynthesis